jgi:D-glycero-D-manno-heptose 1,7-bisphosphate phosphatase
MKRDLEAVFLDRDGVINENRADHVKNWSEFQFLPGAPDAIRRLTKAGYRVFIVSNQAIINRGVIPGSLVDQVHDLMLGQLDQYGARVEAMAYCPHRTDENCLCRKPKPGLLVNLAQRFGVNLTRAVVIGDALSDIEAGLAVGCRTILVLTGRGREQLAYATAVGANGFMVADDLSAAVDLLLITTDPEPSVLS